MPGFGVGRKELAFLRTPNLSNQGYTCSFSEPAEPGLYCSFSELRTETPNSGQKHNPGPSCSSPICPVFNRSLSLGFVPDIWKEAHVCPIPEGGDKTAVSNYRPILLLHWRADDCPTLDAGFAAL